LRIDVNHFARRPRPTPVPRVGHDLVRGIGRVERASHPWLGALVACLTAISTSQGGSVDRDLLRRAVDANSASVRSIYSFYGHVKVVHVRDQSLGVEGEYWRIGERDRYRCKIGDMTFERNRENTIDRGYAQGVMNGENYLGGSVVNSNDGPQLFDPWMLALFTLPSPRDQTVPLSELLAHEHELLRAEEVK
jgi:hypothetical protein